MPRRPKRPVVDDDSDDSDYRPGSDGSEVSDADEPRGAPSARTQPARGGRQRRKVAGGKTAQRPAIGTAARPVEIDDSDGGGGSEAEAEARLEKECFWHTGNYFAEYAKSGRAKCKVCGEGIALKELRVGVEHDDKGLGIIKRWQHPACTRIPASLRPRAEEIEGFDELEDADKETIRAMLAARGGLSHLTVDPDKEVAEQAKEWTATREAPSTLLAPLLPYQREGLGWLCAQEEGDVRGGILADEMGMGKTLQAIALILSRPRESSAGSTGGSAKARGKAKAVGKGSGPVNGGTLIVVPVVALQQWRTEVLKWTAPGTLSVLIYHGAKREALPAALASHDIVLTTYSTLEYEYRTAIAPQQVTCEYCKRRFKNDQKLAFHLRWFCGPDAQRSEAQSKTQRKDSATRLGRMLLGNAADDSDDDDDSDSDDDSDWEEPAKGKRKVAVSKHKGAINKRGASGHQKASGASGSGAKGKGAKGKGAKGNGAKGKRAKGKGAKGKGRGGGDDSDDSDSDSTDDDDDDGGGDGDGDGELSARAKRAKEKDEALALVLANSALHRVRWHRIILDEAHAIKERRTSTAQAAFALEATHRWCLTGTPLQNRVGELYSLVQFLRLDPYAYYFCRAQGCNCKCREYKFDAEYRYCMYCGHSPLQHYSLFNRDIVNPIRKFGYIGAGRAGFVTLKRDVLSRVLLRRTKAGRASEMVLPPKLVTIEANFLDEKETDFYQAIYTQSVAQFGAYVAAGTLLNNYAHIFDLLTRLRQATDHPYLVIATKRDDDDDAPGRQFEGEEGVVCGLCHEDAEDSVRSECGHTFCRHCAAQYIETVAPGAPTLCPTCRAPFSIELRPAEDLAVSECVPCASAAPARARRGILAKLDLPRFQSSTKIEALLEELHHMRRKDPAAKAIVFSQFVNFLDLMEHRMHLARIKVVKLNGGMTVSAREASLGAFRDDPDVQVILISLKAGGVALNLTVASHIYLMDPWWNPAAEYQAIDRAHRLGQHKPIRATRFVVRNTVEERILRLQDKKRLVFEGTVGGDVASLSQLSEEDLRFLFQN